jgi:hypothetical protein
MTETMYELFGFSKAEHGKQESFIPAAPFIVEDSEIYLAESFVTGKTPHLYHVPAEEASQFLIPLDRLAYLGENEELVLTGRGFMRLLDSLGIKHELNTWFTAEDYFWNLLLSEDYEELNMRWGRKAADWLEKQLLSGSSLHEEKTKIALSLMYTGDAVTKKDWVLSTVAAELIHNTRATVNRFLAVRQTQEENSNELSRNSHNAHAAFESLKDFEHAIRQYKDEHKLFSE